MKHEPFVTIVILNWNGRRFLKDCLDSVFNLNYRNYNVILVDNASSDGSVEFVKKKYGKYIRTKKLKIVINHKNLGFAEGNNVGIRKALKNKRVKYIVLLNNDTKVNKDWLKELVKVAERDEKVGIVQGKLLQFDGKTIDSTGIELYQSLINTVDRGQGEIDVGQYDQECEIIAACAAGALYRREMLEDVAMGGEYLDSDFFCTWEDTDISFRALLKGWKIRYTPYAVMFHKRCATTGIATPFSVYYLHRNNLWFVAKCIPTTIFLKYFIFFLLFNVISFGVFLTMRRKLFPAFVKAKLDSLRNLKKILRKRKRIMKNACVCTDEIERLIKKKFISPSFRLR